MAADPTLRHLFPKDDGTPNTLDASAIIRRSRARRLPKRLAVGSVTTLAVAGIVIASVQGVGVVGQPATQVAQSEASAAKEQPVPTSSMPSDATQFSAPLGDSGVTTTHIDGSSASAELGYTFTETAGSTFAETSNRCAGPVAATAPSRHGLEVSIDFPRSANLDGQRIEGTVTLTNASETPVVGLAGDIPVIVLSRDDVVLWYSNGLAHSLVALYPTPTFQPGESITFDADFWPVTCEANQDNWKSGKYVGLPFGADLPQVESGDYQLSALVDFKANSKNEVISSPLTTITLK